MVHKRVVRDAVAPRVFSRWRRLAAIWLLPLLGSLGTPTYGLVPRRGLLEKVKRDIETVLKGDDPTAAEAHRQIQDESKCEKR